MATRQELEPDRRGGGGDDRATASGRASGWANRDRQHRGQHHAQGLAEKFCVFW